MVSRSSYRSGGIGGAVTGDWKCIIRFPFLSLYSTRIRNTWRWGLALGSAPDARILRWGYQHVGILEPMQILASGVICVTPDANPRRQSVEYRWRWVPGVGSLRWACTFHIFCVDYIGVGHPTQTRFSVEYGLYYTSLSKYLIEKHY